MTYTRYAIWWVPHPGSALARFGAAWTGWCADRGLTSKATARAALSRGWPGVPGGVARQGLHANVKSPFRLAEGRGIWALESALEALADRVTAVRLPRLALTVFDGRVVLAPTRPEEGVSRLMRAVAEAVRPVQVRPPYPGFGRGCELALEGVAVPGTRDWGACAMPTLERFHVPLTDRLTLGTAYEVVAELEPTLGEVLGRRQLLADLALVGDPGGGRPWRVIARYPLQCGAAPADAGLPAEMDCLGPSLMTPLGSEAARTGATH